MGTSNVQNAAQQAASASGLPASVTATLITLEGPSQSAPNNPFDITKTWADLSGVGQFVTGIFNSVGVAIFADESQAIKGWAYGLLNFSNYNGVRGVMNNPHATVQDFFNALGATGYAGGDSSYAANLGRTFQSITGQDPSQTVLRLAGVITSPTGPPTTIYTPPGTPTGPPPVPGNPTLPTAPTPIAPTSGGSVIDIPTPFGTIHIDFSAITNALNGIGNSASNAAQGLVAGVNNASTTVNNATDFLKWLGQPNLVLRFALFPVGVGIAFVGLILFALSFWPRGSQVVQSGVAALAE